MNLIRALAVIFGCLAVGETITHFSGISLPGSIIGLLLLTLLLQTKVVKAEWLEQTAGVLIKYMGFFFIPPGVGLISYFGLIRAQWCPIVVSSVLSTLLVLAATAFTFKLFHRNKK